MAAQDAVELGAETLDCGPALLVEEVGAEFYRDAGEGFEGVREQEQFGLGVEAGALVAAGVPGGADFDATGDAIDVHVGGHADRAASGGVDDGEWQHEAGALKGEAALDFGGHGGGLGDGGVPELPKFAVSGGVLEVRVMLRRKRDEADEAAFNGDGIEVRERR